MAHTPSRPPEPFLISGPSLASAHPVIHPSMSTRPNPSSHIPISPFGSMPQLESNTNTHPRYTPPTFDRPRIGRLGPNSTIVPTQNVAPPLLTRIPPGPYIPARGNDYFPSGSIPRPPSINPNIPHRIAIFNGPPVPGIPPRGGRQYVPLIHPVPLLLHIGVRTVLLVQDREILASGDSCHPVVLFLRIDTLRIRSCFC